MTILTSSSSYTYLVVGGSVATYTRGVGQDGLMFSSWFNSQEEAVEYLIKHRNATVFN
jgi:hypothetical protein